MPVNFSDTNNLTFKPEPPQEGYQIGQGIFIHWLNTQGKLILIFLELIILAILSVNFYFIRKSNQVEKSISDKYELYMRDDNQKIIKEFQTIQQNLTLISEKISSQDHVEAKFSNTIKLIPASIKLTALSYESGAVALRATAPDPGSFALFVNNLINDTTVKSVVLRQSTFDKVSDLFSFEIVIGY